MGKCRDCKYANEYIPSWGYPWMDPRCSIHHKSISPDEGCSEFEQIGRLSR